jgi:hypothetical protein
MWNHWVSDPVSWSGTQESAFLTNFQVMLMLSDNTLRIMAVWENEAFQRLAGYSPNLFSHSGYSTELHFQLLLHLDGAIWQILTNSLWVDITCHLGLRQLRTSLPFPYFLCPYFLDRCRGCNPWWNHWVPKWPRASHDSITKLVLFLKSHWVLWKEHISTIATYKQAMWHHWASISPHRNGKLTQWVRRPLPPTAFYDSMKIWVISKLSGNNSKNKEK